MGVNHALPVGAVRAEPRHAGPYTMRTAQYIAGAICLVLATAGLATGQSSSTDMQRRQRELKAKFQRDTAEMKRKHEQRVKQLQGQQAQPRQQTLQTLPHPSAERQSEPSVAAFNAATAPPPVECLARYVAAVHGASSMEPLLKYLPLSKQRTLKALQSRYDPREAAKKREWFRQKNAQLDAASLTFLTNPPYVNELDHHKRTAGKILDVLNVTIDGNKAVIAVSTVGGALVNNVKYPYGTAHITMLGEEGCWKIDGYNDSEIVYLHPPQPKQ